MVGGAGGGDGGGGWWRGLKKVGEEDEVGRRDVTSQRLALEIVRFGESSPLTVLKRVERGKYPGPYKAPFVLIPSRCGTLHVAHALHTYL